MPATFTQPDLFAAHQQCSMCALFCGLLAAIDLVETEKMIRSVVNSVKYCIDGMYGVVNPKKVRKRKRWSKMMELHTLSRFSQWRWQWRKRSAPVKSQIIVWLTGWIKKRIERKVMWSESWRIASSRKPQWSGAGSAVRRRCYCYELRVTEL